MTDETSHNLRGDLLARATHNFVYQAGEIGKMGFNFTDTDEKTPPIWDDPIKIRMYSVKVWETALGLTPTEGSEVKVWETALGLTPTEGSEVKVWETALGLTPTEGSETGELNIEKDQESKKQYKYVAGLLADLADEVECILNYDNDELRAKHEGEFGG